MKRAVWFVVSLLILVTLACGFNASSANIAGAKMARDAEGSDPTTVFNQDEVFYAVVDLANAPDDTKIKASWVAVDADGTDPNLVIDEVEVTAGSGSVNFNLTNDKLWPVGTYKVDLYLNDELDRTLDFTVEGEVVAEQEPTPTPEPGPTDTPEPSPTPEPEPTNTPRSSGGDSLGGTSGGDTLGGGEEEPVAEPLPFQPEPYTHPSGAFTFILPETFEGLRGDATSVLFGDDLSQLGAEFANTGTVLSEDEVLDLSDRAIGIILSDIDENYEIFAEDNKLAENGFIFKAVSFADGDGRADFFFDQRGEIVFAFYFISLAYDEMDPTWSAIIDSYDIDGEAALKAAPGPTPTSRPQPPTATPASAANPFAPPPGVARVYMQNFYGSEYNIDFGDGTGSKAVLPGAQNFYHDVAPGKYNPGLSLPGGGATNVEFEIKAGEAFLIIVTEDLGVRWGKVYP